MESGRARTTVRLDESLLREAKVLAAERRTTLTALIEAGLRALIRGEKATASGAEKRVVLPVSKARGGTCPGVDLENRHKVLDLMEQG